MAWKGFLPSVRHISQSQHFALCSAHDKIKCRKTFSAPSLFLICFKTPSCAMILLKADESICLCFSSTIDPLKTSQLDVRTLCLHSAPKELINCSFKATRCGTVVFSEGNAYRIAIRAQDCWVCDTDTQVSMTPLKFQYVLMEHNSCRSSNKNHFIYYFMLQMQREKLRSAFRRTEKLPVCASSARHHKLLYVEFYWRQSGKKKRKARIRSGETLGLLALLRTCHSRPHKHQLLPRSNQ